LWENGNENIPFFFSLFSVSLPLPDFCTSKEEELGVETKIFGATEGTGSGGIMEFDLCLE
jgi:hypothetical protein